jgi:hypothetical protein
MRHRLLSVLVCWTVLCGGCATLACTPTTLSVAGKEERSVMRSEVRGVRTDSTGRVSEDRRQVIVPEYWVRDAAGQWYRVTEKEFHTAEPDRQLSICR